MTATTGAAKRTTRTTTRKSTTTRTRAAKPPEPGPLDPPAGLDENAAKVWREVVEAHHEPTRIVGADLEAYCGQVALLRKARELVASEGPFYVDDNGRKHTHPAIDVERTAQVEIRAWGDRFRPRPKLATPAR